MSFENSKGQTAGMHSW